ncbi:MAG: hypothetical protein LBV77_01590 [Candidatus Adiutrix intracellularis]|nr:hypothetical protein [Candidatus Adiutrix intracellularis]
MNKIILASFKFQTVDDHGGLVYCMISLIKGLKFVVLVVAEGRSIFLFISDD